MAEWLVELKGETAELEYLCKLPSSQGWIMTEQDGRYYLESEVFGSSVDAPDVLAGASRILDVMNGVARLVLKNFEGPIVEGAIKRIEKNGKPPTQFVIVSGIASAEKFGSMNVTIPSGQEVSHPPSIPGSKWIEIAEKDPSVHKALALYGRPKHDWRSLYMVLEAIEDDVGGERGLIVKGWAQKNQIKLFKQTANSFLSLGYQARHATAKHQAARKPMFLEDAKSLIKNILEIWLRSK